MLTREEAGRYARAVRREVEAGGTTWGWFRKSGLNRGERKQVMFNCGILFGEDYDLRGRGAARSRAEGAMESRTMPDYPYRWR